MPELYQNLGFTQHPFSKYSAEEETQYLSHIYVKPRYFDSLLNDLKTGASRFILGERGSGKSALVFELHKKLSDENIFSVIVDNYDSIPLQNNDRYLLHLIIKSLLKSYVASIFKNKQLIKNLTKADREKLALIIRDFFTTISKREFEETYNKVTNYKTRNAFKNIYNYLFNKPINWAISVGLELGSDFVAKTLNLPKLPNDNFYKNYLPQINLESLPDKEKEEVLIGNYNLLKDILLDLVGIIQRSGFSTTVIFLDKIDEFKLLEGKINKIVDFTEEILKDTSLLYLNNISLVFSIWTEVKIELNAKGVRFDKFKPIDINWTNDDIKNILKKRLDYFSQNHSYDSNQLFEAGKDLDGLIELAYKSPRDLIRLFSIILDEQAIEDSNRKNLSSHSVSTGKVNYCKTYDYYSIFPSRRGTKEDIISIANRILRVGRTHFRTTDLVNEFKFSQQSAINYIKIYKDYGLVKDSDNIVAGIKDYVVIDPKLTFLILTGIKNL